MKRLTIVFMFVVAALFLLLMCSIPASARGHSHSYTHHEHARSARAKAEFKQAHPCPGTGKHYGSCPGYVIDHVTPLCKGGADSPSNMQWQTVAEGKAKDKWECK